MRVQVALHQRVPANLRGRFDLGEAALAAAFAANVDTPPEVLQQLEAALTLGGLAWSTEGRLQVALALAGNPRVAPDALAGLEKTFDGDAHKQVHAAARKNPSYPSLWHRLTH